MGKYENYTFRLVSAINEVFNEESEHFIASLDEIDATTLFTALLGASNYVFNDLTDDNKNLIEMTHVLNSLAVQHIVKNSDK
ncbi:hypothetical protein [Peribacillus frigoritolerans]|uniref:hypothetical protein n=1 Tax=Peribacillus frigoritolerans TaxID=450367 RepID=UPI002E20B0A4|nr:hypothetical protein [Peribacillus frigoritolerans]MED3845558.1 hypothetical protein [Peribacillus frigoritolerans]